MTRDELDRAIRDFEAIAGCMDAQARAEVDGYLELAVSNLLQAAGSMNRMRHGNRAANVQEYVAAGITTSEHMERVSRAMFAIVDVWRRAKEMSAALEGRPN